MDQVASILGIPLPVYRARDAVMKQTHRSRRRRRENSNSVFLHRDSLLLHNHSFQKQITKDDDDTASTVSNTTVSTLYDYQISSTSVTFAEPLVTHVFERPRTNREEKRVLHYADYEYRQFRRDYIEGVRHRDPVVKFKENLVTNVHVYPQLEENEALFYSESDLQR